jgi:hypothetical protein
MSTTAVEFTPEGRALATRPPGWMIAVTAVLALGVLAMAVAETNLWLHYLIDAGEPVSLAGLGFVAVAGLFLYSRRQLRASLPLMAPWLLFPVITQGDQIIDNLSINWMRLIVHVLLGLIFGIPVAVGVSAIRAVLAHERVSAFVRSRRWLFVVPGLSLVVAGRVREGSAVLAVLLMTVLMGVAVQFLGLLMVVTLAVMIWGVLVWGFLPASVAPIASKDTRRTEGRALALLAVGIVASLGLYVGYKNRPGAYQGSPAYLMDPSQRDAGFRLDRVAVPAGAVTRPADADIVRRALSTYGEAFERLMAGYYVLDRNYNYDFHNRLFVRSTPLLPSYRQVGLERVHQAVALRKDADQAAAAARAQLAPDDPLGALLDDVRAYAAFTFDRAPVLEGMSADFAQTEAGLQHSTHLFEGEGKVVGVRLAEVLTKHQRVLMAQNVADLTGEFQAKSRAVHDLYANRIVGF